MIDRDGNPLKIGTRCRRFTESGMRLKSQIVIVGFDEVAGTVIAEDIKNLQRVVTLPARLQRVGARIGGCSKNQPKKVVSYERDREIAKEASLRLKKTLKRKK